MPTEEIPRRYPDLDLGLIHLAATRVLGVLRAHVQGIPDWTQPDWTLPGHEAGRLGPMEERPPPDPAKLLAQWMEWERGDENPGRVMANLKTGGLRELLEQLVAVQQEQVAG